MEPTRPGSFASRRYSSSKKLPSLIGSYLVPAGRPSIVDTTPEGWKSYTDPESQPYFVNPTLKVVTESNILEAAIREHLELSSTVVQRMAANHHPPIDMEGTELFLEYDISEPGTTRTLYYVADRRTQSVFWVKDLSSTEVIQGDAYSEGHIRKCQGRRIEYWTHVEMFPMHAPYPKEEEHVLKGILTHSRIDGMTCLTSTAVYQPEMCKDFLKILEGNRDDGYKLYCLARIAKDVSLNRLVRHHGQQWARLERTASYQTSTLTPLPWLADRITSLLLFKAHRERLRSLDKLFVDQIVYICYWREFIVQELSEWQEVTLVATVLWTVDMGVLQLIVGNTSDNAAIIKGMAVTSTICGMVSTAISLYLGQKHRKRAKKETADDLTAFLRKEWDPERGFLKLAILHCLPRTFLIWAFVFAGVTTLLLGLDAPGNIVFGSVLAIAFSIWTLFWLTIFRGTQKIRRNWGEIISTVTMPGRQRTTQYWNFVTRSLNSLNRQRG
ncbi:hypothetical protein BU17DRAFT_96166 [Hysterangium stoloniferum]|nr:hypothetical protein BU17DRAFT_96166 [Hysterangium stoloniferum]